MIYIIIVSNDDNYYFNVYRKSSVLIQVNGAILLYGTLVFITYYVIVLQ